MNIYNYITYITYAEKTYHQNYIIYSQKMYVKNSS
jgi:hypothetical protein